MSDTRAGTPSELLTSRAYIRTYLRSTILLQRLTSHIPFKTSPTSDPSHPSKYAQQLHRTRHPRPPSEPIPSLPSFIISLQKILNTLSSTPGALTFQFRKSVSTSSSQLLLLASWTDKYVHDYLDVHGITSKLLKEMFTSVKPELVHFMDLDVSQVDFDAGSLSVDIFSVKEGRRGEFREELKRAGTVGGWYVAKGVPQAPKVMPNDEKELEIIRMQRERAEKAMGEKVPDVWVGISKFAGEGEGDGFRERTEELVDRCVSGKWEKYLEGRKDAPLGGIHLK